VKEEQVGIVGGGLAGLAAGIGLARKGLKVTIFEASDTLGGCCATTRLGGYTFNDGALYLALPEILDHGFERLGLDRAELLPLRQIAAKQTTHLDNGATLTFETGTGVRQSGTDTASDLNRQLASLKERWEPVLRILGQEIIPYPASAPRMAWKLWRHLPRLAGTVASELGRQINDPQLRAALASMALYTGVPAERTPAAQMGGWDGYRRSWPRLSELWAERSD
jgi:phytoene desaturase